MSLGTVRNYLTYAIPCFPNFDCYLVIMLLKLAGIDHPMAVVFTGMACGICALEDLYALLFCSLMLALLFSLSRLPHMVAGLFLGLIAIVLVPKTIWIEGEHMLTGRVVSSGFEHGIFRIELDRIQLDGAAYRGRACINVYQAGSLDGGAVARGVIDPHCQMITTRVTLKPPRALGNLGEFDYARELRSQGITITGYSKDWGSAIITPAASGFTINPRRFTTQASAILSGLARPEAEVLRAILWGDRSYLTNYSQDRFAALGLSHLIAISGLNIGLIVLFGYMLAYTVMRMLPRLAEHVDTPMLAKMAGLVCAVFFAVIVEPSYPTTRSVLMTIIVIMALVFARRTALVDALALAGCIILIIWPLSLFTAGFLLSFAAVLGLIVVLERLQNASVFMQSLAVPITAAAFTLPIAVYVFGFIAPWSIPI